MRHALRTTSLVVGIISMTDELEDSIEEKRVVPEPLMRWTGAILSRASQRVRDSFENRMSGSCLKSKHYGALILLEDGPKTQIELGRQLWVDRTSMVALVDELERSGDVKREKHPDDRRAYLIQLTEQGKTSLQHAREIADEVEDEIFSALSEEEREQLRELLARLI
ncbi:MAG: MarR family transcriptional regulator [Proteobacteria bacterium]|nr:MAG: MarR family transcriptional regulator [Pseudomonadota bacterium]